jgi:hypothetical protein
VKYTSSDSVEALMPIVARIMPLDVVPRVPFMQQHPRFLMFSKPDRWDWLYEHLVKRGLSGSPAVCDAFRKRR